MLYLYTWLLAYDNVQTVTHEYPYVQVAVDMICLEILL